MIVFRDRAALEARRAVAAGPLAPLADSLAADLEPWLGRDIALPAEKARLTRHGGRCPADGTPLAFDPASPRRHRCPHCGTVCDDEAHYRWWIMSFHLWYAERGVHAALLHALRGDARHRRFATTVIESCAERYLDYPNRDNVLGPTRPFFSTYLESIWLLQLCAALDLLETAGAAEPGLSATARERLLEPSRALVASYDEGGSNRQVWNAAALAASSLLLGDRAAAERALLGPAGVGAQLRDGLLPDGSWYEGENYHQFAQRGLWYGMHLAGAAGIGIDAALVARFDRAAALPFLTAMPGLTVPARRDSPWNVSLRQWRFAEVAELGLARTRDDHVLRGALHALYDPAIPRGDTQRARSTAEAERNVPASGLTRADLGWRALVAALPELPALEAPAPGSLLLPWQGLAILRRDAGRVYVALDFGESGGGHGHPDRLNLLLAHDGVRWLDDAGTGSYTTDDLFWYRSALAHNAPFANHETPALAAGVLRAWDDLGDAGWVDAEFRGASPGVVLRRSLVAMPGYLLDHLEWDAPGDATIDLPLHVDGTVAGVVQWEGAGLRSLFGDRVRDEGFAWLRSLEFAVLADGEPVVLEGWAPRPGLVRSWPDVDGGAAPPADDGDTGVDGDAADGDGAELESAAGDDVDSGAGYDTTAADDRGATPDAGDPHRLQAWICAPDHFGLWRARAPGPAGTGPRRFHALSCGGGSGSLTIAWVWTPEAVASVHRDDDATTVELASGARHVHARAATGWRVEVDDDAGHRTISLGGLVATPPADTGRREPGHAVAESGAGDSGATRLPRSLPAHFELGEAHWRATEDDWVRSGAPRATVDVTADAGTLRVAVRVPDREPLFAPWREENELDNEAPDVNSDGVQLHLSAPERGLVMASWLLVPDDDGSVRFTPGGAAERDLSLTATFTRDDDGWAIAASWPRTGPLAGPGFRLDVLVNDISAERERRRGQLVLSGARGDRAYLAGDRQPADRYLPFAFPGA
ncbi:MAG: heparinase II/III family protein [Gemmatimonadetes bacterium]|nr:heparinase II/III family protein [Gemmatimonadota bacterium]